MLSTAVVLALSCIQSHNKKWLTDIMIYFLANVGKFYWTLSHGWKVCLRLLGSVCPSVHLSVLPSVYLSSILLFALLSFQKCKFSWNLCISFLWYLAWNQGSLWSCLELLQKNLVWAKMSKNWSKMAPKSDFSTISKNFLLIFA